MKSPRETRNFKVVPFNGVIYSKCSAEVTLDGKQSNKFDNRVVIIEGSFQDAC
jgi:hypothetical protein